MQNNHKKAACAAVLCMAMAAPLAGIAENETRVITCGTLNLREAASTDSRILGKYGWGTEVLVKGQSGDWMLVDVGSQSGYMYGKYLGSEGEANSIAYVKTNTRGLNLRSEPNGTIIGSYPRGTKVTVLSSDGTWSKVSVGSTTGYMSSQWLSAKKPGAYTPPSVPAIGKAVVNNPRDTQVLFLRSEPSIASKALGYYHNGKEVKLLEKLGDWYKVSVDNQTGYMMARFLKVTQEAVSGTATVFNPNGGSYVNFRKAPSLSASVLNTVSVGTKINVLEKTTDWTKTEIDGVTGYISTWFLKF